MSKKLLKKARKKANSFEDSGQAIIDAYQISPELRSTMISELMRNLGTQAMQAKNTNADTLFDAPEATRIAANRGVDINSNVAVNKGTLAIDQLSEGQRLRGLDKGMEYSMFNQQLRAQEDAAEAGMWGELFGAIGSMINFGSKSPAPKPTPTG